MKKFIYCMGIFMILFGFSGGHEYIAKVFSSPSFNIITKDGVTAMFRLVFLLMSSKKT